MRFVPDPDRLTVVQVGEERAAGGHERRFGLREAYTRAHLSNTVHRLLSKYGYPRGYGATQLFIRQAQLMHENVVET